MTIHSKYQYPILFFILFVCWSLVQLTMYLHFGIVTPADSAMYIEDAQKLLIGIVPTERSTWYLGYSSFLATVFYLQGSLKTVVFLQILFSGIAAVSMFLIAEEIFKSKLTGIMAAFLFIAWFKIHQWNVYIYTESMFTSFCIISLMLLVKSGKKWHYLIVLFISVFTFLLRPAGFGFAIGLICFFIGTLPKIKVRKGISVVGSVALAVFVILGLNFMLKDYVLVESYAKAEIIYPNITLGIQMPGQLLLPSEQIAPLAQLILFFTFNPLYFLKISMIKLGLFFGSVKPYFSFVHNLFIAGILYPLYFLAVKGYRHFPANRKEVYFFLGFIVSQALTVMLTTENWDGRFLIPVLPFIFIFSAHGIHYFYQKHFSKLKFAHALQTKNMLNR